MSNNKLETKIVKPTIRMDKKFNLRLKKVLLEQGVSMQELVLKYLESYVEEKEKGVY